MISEIAIPRFQSFDLDETQAFYELLGFKLVGHLGDRMIMKRDSCEIQFWLGDEVLLDEFEEGATGACFLRSLRVEEMHNEFSRLDLSPGRLEKISKNAGGLLEFHVTDPHGNLITVGQPAIKQPVLDKPHPRNASGALQTPGISIGGVNGCKSGWIMVRRRADGAFDDPVFAATPERLPETDFVVVDIPIGLPESGRRACDLEARKLLGIRRNSVFTGVRRKLLEFDSYHEANAWAKSDGLGISKQLWAILPKIAAVDAWMLPARQGHIVEGHPELSFAALGHAPMEHYKKDSQGEEERIAALSEFIGTEQLRGWFGMLKGGGAQRDDIVDAAGLCWSAARLSLGISETVPERPELDRRGFRMEMNF